LEEDASVGVEPGVEPRPVVEAKPSMPEIPPSAQETALLELPSAAFPVSRNDGSTAASEAGAAQPAAEPPPAKPRNRAKRSSVPSWDEIVFGAKPER
jgi:hypothetical protein